MKLNGSRHAGFGKKCVVAPESCFCRIVAEAHGMRLAVLVVLGIPERPK